MPEPLSGVNMDRSIYKSQVPGAVGSGSVPDKEIDLLQLGLKLWGYRKWISIGTLAATFIGLVYSLLVTPIYRSFAIVAPRETRKEGVESTLLSQFGSFGGIVATQLMSGSNNLDRIVIIAKSWGLAEYVIKEDNLLPILFPSRWNSVSGAWKDSNHIPSLRKGINLLRETYLTVITDPKADALTVGIESPNPKLSAQLVEYYLAALNAKIQQDIISESNANRLYLEKELGLTMDPLIHGKIVNMMAFEMEKSMLVSSQSFDILEKPVVPEKRERPNRKLILLIAFFGGFVVSVITTFTFMIIRDIRSEMSLRNSKAGIRG
jgi:uncharacterized protein involved in exopolysaccharide biosynthesis